MVAKRFDGNQADLPITEPPNWTTQKTYQPSRLELDTLATVFEDGKEIGRGEILTQLQQFLSPSMYNYIVTNLDALAVQG